MLIVYIEFTYSFQTSTLDYNYPYLKVVHRIDLWRHFVQYPPMCRILN